MIQNIQTLFSRIRPQQLRAYLSLHGWQVRESGERLEFEKRNEKTGESETLLVPNSETHPKYRRLLPNLIFALAVSENREALDLANEIYATATAVPAVTTPASAPPNHLTPKVSVRFRNTSSSASQVTVLGEEAVLHHQLEQGEEVWVELSSGTVPCVIGFSGQLGIPHDANGATNVLMGLPVSLTRQTTENWLARISGCLADQTVLDGDKLPSLVKASEKLVTRFLFAVGGGQQDQSQAASHIRFTAQLVCELAHQWPQELVRSLALYELTRMALADVGLTFDLNPANASRLEELCQSDDPESPLQTLAWLKQQTYKINAGIPRST